jgi:hypothetical protein
MPGDRAFIIVGLMRGDSVIALQDSCTFKIDSTINQFTTREFPIRVQSNLVPDSLVIIVASGLGSGQAGTELIVDEIAFGTGSAGVSGEIHPAAFALGQNYPNPFNPETVIRYSLIVSGLTTLKVYDVLGREVATLVNEVKTPGKYSVKWDARNAASGVYFYKLQSGSFVDVKKLAVLK